MDISKAWFIGASLLAFASASAAQEETARINAWFDAKYEEQLDLSPMARAYAGEKKDYDKIDDLSEAAADRALEWQRKSVEELRAKFDRAKLPPDAQLSYDLWVYQYQDAASLARFKRNVYVFNQLLGPHTRIPQFLMQVHRVDEPADMDAYIARIGGVARAQLQLLDIARKNAAAGSRVPRFSYEAMILQARALITGAPFGGEGDSAVWTDIQAKVDGLVRTGKIDSARAAAYKLSARKALLAQWQPAYDRVIAWFESELTKADTIATGVGKHPNGQAFYEAMLASSTTTRLTPAQVHQLGLDEVARIKGEMERIKQQVGFAGTLQEFFKFVRDDPRFYYPNTDVGRQAYIDAATAHIAFMKQQLPRYFGILPKADVIVKRVEAYREIPGAPQEYFIGAADGSRPGVYYAHLSDMHAMPIPQLEVIAYHEALPGHHLNFAIASELTDIPKFRKYLSINAYQEGWGLYTEQLAKEMGAYRDPYSDFGRLSAEIWRAIRLVIDTGLHSKGWTEAQSVKYFSENSPAAERQIRAEVQRYIIAPGQATGYKIGMIKILELRRRAEERLGSKFDIRGFHDTILGRGQMPLDLLERRVDQWIAEQTFSEADAYREYGYISLKDGTRLAHVLWRPGKERRYPTLLTYSEYNAGGLPFNRAKEFLEAGYAVLGVNARGTGCSEGDGYSFLDPQAAPDGAEVVEWAAAQPWSNGNIGMFGGSNAGMSQLAVAARRPPHLKAIAPTAIAGSLYREEGATAGGMIHLGEAASWTFDLQPKVARAGAEARIQGGDTECTAIRATRPAETSFYRDVLAHPLQDRWWESRALENTVHQVRVPTLIQQTWQDPWDMPDGALRLFERLSGENKRLVVQNGGHGDASSTPRLIRWFDRWVKGEKNGVENEPPVLINWEHGGSGSSGWSTSYPSWPVPGLQRQALYLTGSGELTREPPPSSDEQGIRSYVYPMGTELVGSNEHFALAPLPIGSLNYETEVMSEDLALLGTPILTFYFSSDQRDTDFLFTLKDIDARGDTLFLQRAYLRASLRRIDPSRTTPDYIAHSFRRHEKLVPGKIYEIKLSLGAIGHVVRKGHRLQLSILAPNPIPSPVMGSVPSGGPSINKVYHSSRHRSMLSLPVVPGESAQAPAPECGSLPMQPCRPAAPGDI
ncbi:DUF885 family protein [Peristeroidobacter soli]|uniref:DUF885 family protein n=1 Tax=Peristeroidobacter soli TaxID=2497877 RepID=UPI00101C2438|nr:DUF885 family protein [Peristeroidobacter soli]